MNKEITDAAKGAGIGLAVGAAAGFAGSMVKNGRRHSMKRRAKKAAGAFGNMIDAVSVIFK